MNTNIIKLVGQPVISMGVGTVVGFAVKAITPSNVGKLGKFLTFVGSAALGGYLGEKVANELVGGNEQDKITIHNIG